jgi:5-carboxymethyl-2-hydroxymuconate isomerase
MPHIIVEYSASLAARVDVSALLKTLHGTLAAAGVDETRIKTRAHPVTDAIVGGAKPGMVHVVLSLLKGRDIPTRKAYGKALYDALHAAVDPAAPGCALTLEVREMEPETYFL